MLSKVICAFYFFVTIENNDLLPSLWEIFQDLSVTISPCFNIFAMQATCCAGEDGGGGGRGGRKSHKRTRSKSIPREGKKRTTGGGGVIEETKEELKAAAPPARPKMPRSPLFPFFLPSSQLLAEPEEARTYM